MDEQIYQNIMRHLDLYDSIMGLNAKILVAAENGDVDMAYQESLNKQRLINVLADVQGKIDLLIKSMPLPTEADTLAILKAWSRDVSDQFFLSQEMDDKIKSHLQQVKEETTKEIASVFRNKETFKGYNLNNLKK